MNKYQDFVDRSFRFLSISISVDGRETDWICIK